MAATGVGDCERKDAPGHSIAAMDAPPEELAPPPRLFARAVQALADAGALRADAERVRPIASAAPLSGKDKDAQARLLALLHSSPHVTGNIRVGV